MPNPVELRDVTYQMAQVGDADNFEVVSIIPPVSRDGILPISLTNLHLVPGNSEPPLHKTEFANPVVPLELAGKCVSMCTDIMTRHLPVFNNDSARSVATTVTRACEGLQHDQPQEREFETIAVLAICFTEAPFVYELISKRFISAFMKHDTIPTIPPAEDMPEEALRQYYARESEHKTDILPYEEWKTFGLASLEGITEESQKHGDAIAMAGMLVLPGTLTHAVLNSELF